MIYKSLVKKARAAGAKLADSELQVQVARTEYHNIVRRMHLTGSSLREIAQALELSHQRVQQIVGAAGGSWWQRVWRSRNATHDLACTFCKRSQNIVTKLIAGPNVFICDACVAMAEQIMSGTSTAPRGMVLAANDARTRCSFCRKQRTSERPVLKGDGENICAQCLNVCQQILIDSSE